MKRRPQWLLSVMLTAAGLVDKLSSARLWASLMLTDYLWVASSLRKRGNEPTGFQEAS